MFDEEIINVLESIGFSKSESIIYLQLVSMGRATAIELAQRTKIHRPNVYGLIDKLIKKSVVRKTTFRNKPYFTAISPQELLGFYKQREYDVAKIIPEIEKKYNRAAEKSEVSLSEGLPSIRMIINNLLDLNQPIYTYGVPKEATNLLGGFIHDFHKRRIEKKIEMKHIYNVDATKRIRQLNNMPLTEARYLPSLYNTSMDTTICGDKVAIWIWEDPYTTIILKNKEISKAYKNYFNILWEHAKIVI